MSDYNKTACVNFSRASNPELLEVFALFDTVGDGRIFVMHVGDALRSLGQNPTKSFLSKCSTNHQADDRLSVDEFTPIWHVAEKQQSNYSAEDIVEVLRNFDKQGNGFMQSVELKRILMSIGEKLTDEEAHQILDGFENSYGNVNYDEFVRHVVSG